MRVCVEADGGSRGNPGIAGSGTVLYADDHRTVLRRLAYVVGGQATNNVAEYHALINGLTAAKQAGATEVDVYMDSKLVVEQMSGRWKIKHPDMKQLALRARRLIEGFDNVSFTWVPRAHNTAADELANAAMDAAHDGHKEGFLCLDGHGDGGEAGLPKENNDTAGGGDDHVEEPREAQRDTNGPARWQRSGGAAATTFILVRHGQTQYSQEGRYSGSGGDPELTDLGHLQAQRIARLIGGWKEGTVSGIVASPLQRAQHTAAHVASAVGLGVESVVTDHGLIEQNFGAWDGMTAEEAARAHPDRHARWLSSPEEAPPDGESFAAVHARMEQWQRRFAAEHSGETWVVVTHVGPIKALIAHALGADYRIAWRMFLDLGGASVVSFDAEGRGLVRSVNVTPELRCG